MATQKPIRIQEYVPNPVLGELLAFANGSQQEPVVLVGFNKEGGWQIAEIRYFQGKIYRRGVLEGHTKRLSRMNVNDLRPELQERYHNIIKILTK